MDPIFSLSPGLFKFFFFFFLLYPFFLFDSRAARAGAAPAGLKLRGAKTGLLLGFALRSQVLRGEAKKQFDFLSRNKLGRKTPGRC